MSDVVRPWARQEDEPIRWFERFDLYYRPLGGERSLLAAYKGWYKAEKGRDSQAVSAPGSWREASQKWFWQSRAEDWDTYQQSIREREEQEARRKNRERRIALLNLTLTKSYEALQQLKPGEMRWGDLVGALRMSVQELRQEYGEQLLNVKVEQNGHLSELAHMTDDQLDLVIANLMAGSELDRNYPQEYQT